MPRPLRLRVVIAAITACLASPAFAQAPSKALQKDADAFFEAGKRLSAAGNHAEACSKFEASQKLDPALATQCNIAIACQQMAGHKEAAWALLQEVQRQAHATDKPKSEQCALDALNALEPELSLLVLDVGAVVSTPGLAITLDGKPVAPEAWAQRTAVEPGQHVVTATATGRKPFEAHVTATEKNKTRITVPALEEDGSAAQVLAPVPPAPPAPPGAPPPEGKGRRLAGVVVGAVGVVGLGVGAGAGGEAVAQHAALAKLCSSSKCMLGPAGSVGLPAQVSGYKTAGLVSTAALIAGGALAATGVILIVTAPRGARPPAVTPVLGLGYAGAQGRF